MENGKRARVALVGAIILSVGAGFLYVGGWLSPHALTQARLVDTLESVNGVHPGFRRNHAKGVGFSGYFEANGQGQQLSKASVFKPGRSEVTGRFALAGGMPYAADSNATVRSMALRISLPGGEEWRMGMNNIPVFPVTTLEAFREQVLALSPDPKTGSPDPVRAQAFFQRHPEADRAIRAIKAHPVASGFDNSEYNSLNAFAFTDATGKVTPVRWSMVPTEPFVPASAAPAPADKNFLFDALIARVKREPLRFHLLVVVGQPGDATNDATVAWPPDRERVDVGVLTIERIEGEQTSPARTINFDPLILPNGIAPSDDPLLSARSATYSVSFRRREGEPVSASAVTVPVSER